MQKTVKVKSKTKPRIVDNKSRFDNLGSYTGVDYQDKYEIPTQDADDL